jgi:TonB dependent receptor.
VSWLGSFSYSYKNKWTINGNIRMDGSNSFGENPKYRFLPVWSVAGKYTISNEPWLINNNIISQLAIRASYGIQGNVDPNTSPSLVIKVGGTNSVTGLNQSSVSMLPNADLRWEKTQSYNIGLDLALFGDLVTGTFDVYKKHGTDIISSTQVASATGRTQLKINSGVVDNSGVEVAIGLHPISNKEWDFYLNANYSYNRNKLIKANSGVVESNSKKIAGIALIEGEALGTLYSYQYAMLNSETGYPIFYDKDGNIEGPIIAGSDDIVQNYSLFDDEIELVKSGVMEPPHFGGLNLTLRYKSFRLSSALSYSAGAVGRLPGIYVDADKAYYADKNMSKEFINRWRKPGDEVNTDIPVLYNYNVYMNLPQRKYSTGRSLIKGRDMYDNSSVRIAKTNVLRMRSLELSYNIPTSVLKKWGIESAMVSLQGTNLFFVADKAWGGMDPESGYASVPIPRTYTLNLSLTF